MPPLVDPLALALLLVDPLALALGDPGQADRLLVRVVVVVALWWGLRRLVRPAPWQRRSRGR